MSLDSWYSMHSPDEPFEYDRSLSADWVPANREDVMAEARAKAIHYPSGYKHRDVIGTRLFLTPLDSEYLEQFGLESDRLLSLLDKE